MFIVKDTEPSPLQDSFSVRQQSRSQYYLSQRHRSRYTECQNRNGSMTCGLKIRVCTPVERPLSTDPARGTRVEWWAEVAAGKWVIVCHAANQCFYPVGMGTYINTNKHVHTYIHTFVCSMDETKWLLPPPEPRARGRRSTQEPPARVSGSRLPQPRESGVPHTL